jgi:hypothetical protein
MTGFGYTSISGQQRRCAGPDRLSWVPSSSDHIRSRRKLGRSLIVYSCHWTPRFTMCSMLFFWRSLKARHRRILPSYHRSSVVARCPFLRSWFALGQRHRPGRSSHNGRGRQRQKQHGSHWNNSRTLIQNLSSRMSYFAKGEAVSWTPSSISSTRAGGSPSRIKGPLVDKYQLVDLLEYSVSTP